MRPENKIAGLFIPTTLLICLVLVSFLGLDYFYFKNESSQSILFKALSRKSSLFYWLNQEIFPFLSQKLGPSLKIHEIVQKPYIKISLEIPEESYEEIANQFRNRINQSGYDYEIKKIQEDLTHKLFEWKLQDKSTQKAIITFSLFKSPQPKPSSPNETLFSNSSKKRASEKMAALIIDDLGDNLEAIKTIINLSRPLDVAILPFSSFARETAELASNHGLEVMLHLPLESVNSKNNGGESLNEINSEMSEEQILAFLKECFEILPKIKGVNNHMGSLITQKKQIMAIILSDIKSRGLFFIDSRTTDKSVAYKLAKEMGLVCGERDFFLDAEANRQSILKQAKLFIKHCEQKGKAIAICHPYPQTLEILPEIIQMIEGSGIKIVPVSRLIGQD